MLPYLMPYTLTEYTKQESNSGKGKGQRENIESNHKIAEEIGGNQLGKESLR